MWMHTCLHASLCPHAFNGHERTCIHMHTYMCTYLEGCGAAELASAVLEPPAGTASDALQRLVAAPAFDRPPGAAQVAMRRPAAAPAWRCPAGAADAAIRRPAAALGLTVAEQAAKKPRTFASSLQELQELKALKDSGVIDDDEFNRLKALPMSEIG